MGQDGAVDHTSERFHHSTLFYSGDDGFLEGTLPFVEGAVTAQEPILVAVSKAKIDLLRGALGGDSQKVHFVDMHILGRNPARIIPAWRTFLADHAQDQRPVRGIGEPIWAGRSAAELTECQRHEALLNVAFDGGQAWQLLCPYDLEALDERVIEEARRSHPFVAQEGGSVISQTYLHVHEGPGPFEGTLPVPPEIPREIEFTADRLGDLRRFVSSGAAEAALERERTEDLVLAINELATNSLRHGGGVGVVRMWAETDTLLCEVHDRGHISELLVGRNRPVATQLSGRGLWMVNDLCDLVQIRSSPAGNVVRVHMRLV